VGSAWWRGYVGCGMDDLDGPVQFEQACVCDHDEVVPLECVDFDVQPTHAVDDFEHLLDVARWTYGWLFHHVDYNIEPYDTNGARKVANSGLVSRIGSG
jgi:hypothetical protein